MPVSNRVERGVIRPVNAPGRLGEAAHPKEAGNPAYQSNSKVGSRKRVEDGKAQYTWRYGKTAGLNEQKIKAEEIAGWRGKFNRNNIASIQSRPNARQDQALIKTRNPTIKKKYKSIVASNSAKTKNNWIVYVRLAMSFYNRVASQMKTPSMKYPQMISDPILQAMFHAKDPDGFDCPVPPDHYIIFADTNARFSFEERLKQIPEDANGVKVYNVFDMGNGSFDDSGTFRDFINREWDRISSSPDYNAYVPATTGLHYWPYRYADNSLSVETCQFGVTRDVWESVFKPKFQSLNQPVSPLVGTLSPQGMYPQSTVNQPATPLVGTISPQGMNPQFSKQSSRSSSSSIRELANAFGGNTPEKFWSEVKVQYQSIFGPDSKFGTYSPSPIRKLDMSAYNEGGLTPLPTPEFVTYNEGGLTPVPIPEFINFPPMVMQNPDSRLDNIILNDLVEMPKDQLATVLATSTSAMTPPQIAAVVTVASSRLSPKELTAALRASAPTMSPEQVATVAESTASVLSPKQINTIIAASPHSEQVLTPISSGKKRTRTASSTSAIKLTWRELFPSPNSSPMGLSLTVRPHTPTSKSPPLTADQVIPHFEKSATPANENYISQYIWESAIPLTEKELEQILSLHKWNKWSSEEKELSITHILKSNINVINAARDYLREEFSPREQKNIAQLFRLNKAYDPGLQSDSGFARREVFNSIERINFEGTSPALIAQLIDNVGMHNDHGALVAIYWKLLNIQNQDQYLLNVPNVRYLESGLYLPEGPLSAENRRLRAAAEFSVENEKLSTETQLENIQHMEKLREINKLASQVLPPQAIRSSGGTPPSASTSQKAATSPLFLDSPEADPLLAIGPTSVGINDEEYARRILELTSTKSPAKTNKRQKRATAEIGEITISPPVQVSRTGRPIRRPKSQRESFGPYGTALQKKK